MCSFFAKHDVFAQDNCSPYVPQGFTIHSCPISNQPVKNNGWFNANGLYLGNDTSGITINNSNLQVLQKETSFSSGNNINPSQQPNIAITPGIGLRIDQKSVVSVNLSDFTTDNLSEGTINKYLTDQRVNDRIKNYLVAGSNIGLSYDTVANKLTISSTTSYSDSNARSAVSANSPLSYNSSTGAFSLGASGVTAGSYGSSSLVPVISVDSYGRVTSVSTSSVSSSGVSSLNSLTGDLTLAAGGINSIISSGSTLTLAATEADTLASVTGRGSTTITALTLSNSSNSITAGTLTATGGTINGTTIGATSATTGVFTTVNGLTITNNGTNTLNVAAGKTLTASNSLTLAGTDSTTMTFPSSSGTVVTLDATQILTNKTLAAGSNTISGLTNSNLSGSAGISNANLANSSITINSGSGLSGGGSVSLGGSLTLTNAGVTSLAGTSNQVTVSGSTGGITISLPQNVNTSATPTFASLTLSNTSNQLVLGTTNTGTLSWSPTSTRTLIFPDVTDTVVATSAAQTLTNKTLTSPVISTISNTGTLTLPTSTDTLVGRATTDTLTNKTLTAPTIQGTVGAGTGLTLPAHTVSGNITGSGSPTISSFGTINGLTLTSNSTGFSIAGGTTSKTLTVNNSITLAGTDSTTITFPSSSDTVVGRTTTDTLTNKTISGNSNTLSAIPLLYSNTSIPGGNTIANTSSETAFSSSYTIPANTLVAGEVIRVKLWGTYGTTTIAPTLTGKFKIGNTVVLNTGALTAVINLTNEGWFVDISLLVQSTGSSGAADVEGYAEFASAATTGLSVNIPNTSTYTIDTTTNQTLSTTITWSSANASNTITLRQMSVEILK